MPLSRITVGRKNFSAISEVLGVIESGVDFEKRIVSIYEEDT
jgi:hypothetical protein